VIKLRFEENMDGTRSFTHIAVCPAMSKHSVKCALPVGALDGAHLTAVLQGTLLTFTSLTTSNNYSLEAFAIVPTESADSWAFFNSALKEAYPDLTGHDYYTMISDRAKGLTALEMKKIFRDWLEKMQHVWCVEHLYRNALKYARNKKRPAATQRCHELVFQAARALTSSEFDACMDLLKSFNAAVHTYMAAIPVAEWTLHAAECNRHYQLTSNLAEVSNHVLFSARKLYGIDLVIHVLLYMIEKRLKRAKVCDAELAAKMEFVQPVREGIVNIEAEAAHMNVQALNYEETKFAVREEGRVGLLSEVTIVKQDDSRLADYGQVLHLRCSCENEDEEMLKEFGNAHGAAVYAGAGGLVCPHVAAVCMNANIDWKSGVHSNRRLRDLADAYKVTDTLPSMEDLEKNRQREDKAGTKKTSEEAKQKKRMKPGHSKRQSRTKDNKAARARRVNAGMPGKHNVAAAQRKGDQMCEMYLKRNIPKRWEGEEESNDYDLASEDVRSDNGAENKTSLSARASAAAHAAAAAAETEEEEEDEKFEVIDSSDEDAHYSDEDEEEEEVEEDLTALMQHFGDLVGSHELIKQYGSMENFNKEQVAILASFKRRDADCGEVRENGLYTPTPGGDDDGFRKELDLMLHVVADAERAQQQKTEGIEKRGQQIQKRKLNKEDNMLHKLFAGVGREGTDSLRINKADWRSLYADGELQDGMLDMQLGMAFQLLLARDHPGILGLQDVFFCEDTCVLLTYLASTTVALTKLGMNLCAVQLHYSPGHFTASICYEGRVYWLDSNNSSRPRACIKKHLAALYTCAGTPVVQVEQLPMHQQTNLECLCRATAVLFEAAQGRPPQEIAAIKPASRTAQYAHLKACLDNSELTAYPHNGSATPTGASKIFEVVHESEVLRRKKMIAEQAQPLVEIRASKRARKAPKQFGA